MKKLKRVKIAKRDLKKAKKPWKLKKAKKY